MCNQAQVYFIHGVMGINVKGHVLVYNCVVECDKNKKKKKK